MSFLASVYTFNGLLFFFGYPREASTARRINRSRVARLLSACLERQYLNTIGAITVFTQSLLCDVICALIERAFVPCWAAWLVL